jgi:hypothetical protein
MSAVEVLVAVDTLRGELGIAGDKLRVLLPANGPHELKIAIRQHKPTLLNLLRLTFVTVRSCVLNATVFFVPDDATKESLVSAGASAGSIYTRSELAVLVRQRVTPSELRQIHMARQIFPNGRICDDCKRTWPN